MTAKQERPPTPLEAGLLVCGEGVQIVRMDYNDPDHPRPVHADGSICCHAGPVRFADPARATQPPRKKASTLCLTA